jgi:hypothetical protein
MGNWRRGGVRERREGGGRECWHSRNQLLEHTGVIVSEIGPDFHTPSQIDISFFPSSASVSLSCMVALKGSRVKKAKQQLFT